MQEFKNKIKHVYPEILKNAFIDSTLQLNPFYLLKNPVLLIVQICLILTILLSINPTLFGPSELSRYQNITISVLLFLTIFFSNLAENIAKQIGKVQADSLRIIHGDIEVKKINEEGIVEYVFASQLKKGDIIKVQEGDLIPLDGEIIEGIASIDESAITGESSPVLKETGTHTASTVTGGTRILTDWLKIRITAEQGETYLDQMICSAEETTRHKSENELSLSSFLTGSTISCVICVIVLYFAMKSTNLTIEYSYLIILLICLIPTTISSLVVPITISGFEKVNELNVVVTSKTPIENAGDIDYIFLDKTGTITHGNRMAMEFIPVDANSILELAKGAYISSLHDQTPEGKSVLTLSKRYGVSLNESEIKGIAYEFSAQTRLSGIDLNTGDIYRKGAVDAVITFLKKKYGNISFDQKSIVDNISLQGGTPLLVSKNDKILGVINLKDLVKTSIKGRFKELNNLGVITVLCTGDNHLTAKVISKEAGIDEFISEAKPEDKIKLIRHYQSQGLLVAMIGDGTNDAPALAQADIGLTMNNGTTAAKEASNMIDLDSDPTKIISIIKVGRQLLATRGALTTFSIINDIAKFFILIPSLLPATSMNQLNFLNIPNGYPAVISALIFNAAIIPIMTPIAIKGVPISNLPPNKLLERNILIFGFGGLVIPIIVIKLISMLVTITI